MIALGGLVAVVANTLYPLARAEEAKARIARDARALLLPEIQRNATLVTTIQSNLKACGAPLLIFDVTAWETISKGGLLLGLKPDEITQLLNIYSLVYQANHLLAQLLEASAGIGSAMASAPQTREVVTQNLEATLNALRDAFSAVEHNP
jgi:hypothetical protein